MVILLAAGAGAGGKAPGEDDPLPLLRVVATPEMLVQELARVKQGALVKLPRDEFEARVRKAAAGRARMKNAARVLRAHYQAELVEQSLVQGHGEWAVHNPGPGAAALPLVPLSLALSRAAWEDGRPAVIGNFAAKGLAAWVEGTGSASLFFDWSCRGTQTPQGMTFDLRVPPCPQTTLELRLPADHWPAVPPRAGLLTGPHDAGTPGKRLWKLQLAGKTQVELTIRQVSAAAGPLFVQSQAQQTVTPDRVAADFDFQIEVPHDAVRELTLEGDGTLEPYEVTARSADLTWRWAPPAGKGAVARGTLTLEFREPQHGRIAGLRVRCLAPRTAAPALWASPGLRLRQAVCRAETLKVHFHPDVHLGRWFGGDFHLLATATEADGGLTLTLANARATLTAPAARPRCQLTTGGAEFATIQQTRWHLAPGASSLQSEIAYVVSRGELYQLAVKVPTVPPAYRVESVEIEPKGLLRSWTATGPLLVAELDHAITPRTDARLRVRLGAPIKSKAAAFTVDVPDIVPLGGTLRDGTLTVELDPLYHAQLLQSSVGPAPPRTDAPPAGPEPAYTFAYRDQTLAGKLRLFGRQPRMRVHSRQQAVLGPATGQWSADVDIDPLLGRPGHIDAYLSAPLYEPWQVKVEGPAAQVNRLERLPIHEALPQLLRLGPSAPVVQAALHLGLPRGELWRMHFTAPLAQTTRLRMQGTVRPPVVPLLGERLALAAPGASVWTALTGIAIAASPSAEAAVRWDIPVLFLPSVHEQDGEIDVRAAGQRLEAVRGNAMEAMPAPQNSTSAALRLDRAVSAWPRLELTTRRVATAAAASAVCESSELTTCMEPDGTLTHLLRVRLRNWQEPRFTVVVPARVQGLAAKVDGGWVDRLDAKATPQGTRFVLPVNIDTRGTQEVELLYASTAPAGTRLSYVVEAQVPVLPRAPLVQHRFWRMPAEWVPFDREQWRPRGEPDAVRAQHALASLPERIWHSGEALLPQDALDSPALEARRDDLRRAESQVRTKLGRQATLGEALDRLAAALPAAMPVVVDVEGLRAAGRAPATLLPANPAGLPLWRTVDLASLICPSAVLFTTPPRLRQWQERARTVPLEGLLDPAVAAAAIHGVDHAGCFASVRCWRRMAATHAPAPASHDIGVAFAKFAAMPAMGWTEWEPLPGRPPTAPLVLLHEPAARRCGYLLAGLWFLAAAWLGRRLGPSAFVRVHLAAATVLVLMALWLPDAPRELLVYPMLLAEALGFVLAFTVRTWPGRAVPRLSKSTMVRMTTAAILCAGTLAALPLLAQAPPARPDPQVVYLMRGDAGREFALATPELLGKLDDLAGQRSARPAGAVVVSAQYHGKLNASVAEVEARFELYHFADQSTFVLPLKNVQLQPGVFLDGAPVFPVAHKDGYALPLHGEGMHQLTLTFQVRSAIVGDLHSLRFDIPRAGQCQLELTGTVPTRGLYLVGGLGEAKLQYDKQGLVTLKAQLGHETVVQLGWPAAVKPAPSPSAVEVREAYYWDLRPQTLGLTAGVQFLVTRGSVAQLRFALPDGLDVRQVDLAARASAPAVAPAPALRQWRVAGTGGGRQLVIDLVQPVGGTVTLLIDMIPGLALTPGQWLLRLPTPLGATSTVGILGYRIDGMEAVATPQNLSVGTVLTPELLAEPWAKLALRDPPAAMKLVKFSRVPRSAALALAVQPARPTAQLDLKWQVTPRHAGLTARLDLAGTADELRLVELELPPRFQLERLSEIGGTHLHHWTRQDRLVQLWLSQPRKQVSLEVHGWVELGKAGPAGSFELMPLRVTQARSSTSTIALEPEPGLALTAERLDGIAITGMNDVLHLRSDKGDYRATLKLRRVGAAATGRAFTLLERHDDVVEMSSALHVRPRPGELRIAVSGWHGADLRLEVPAPVVRKDHKQQGSAHVWTVQLPPGLPQRITFTLRGRFTASRPGQTWTLPAVQLDRVTLTDQWIRLAGVELADGKGIALRPASDPPGGAADFPAPPHELAPDSQIGKLPPAAAPLAVRIPAPAPSAQVLFAEHETLWAGANWLHRLRILAFASSQGELRVRLPDGARCRAIVVDDHVVAPGAADLQVPLVGKPGPRCIDICWTFDRDESVAAPRRDQPIIDGLAADAIHSRFWLPAAYGLPNVPAGLDAGSADRLLRRAAARMELCRVWAQSRPLPEELRREQQAFHDDLKSADALIAQLQHLGTVDTAELTSRSRHLAKENARLAAQGKYAAPPATHAILRPREGLALVGVGVPLDGQSTGTLTLLPASHRDEAFTRSAIEITALATVALLLISLLRRGLALAHVLWPETLAALAAFGVALGGWTPLAVGLLALAIALRGVWLIVLMRRMFPGWFTPATEPANGDDGPIPSGTSP